MINDKHMQNKIYRNMQKIMVSRLSFIIYHLSFLFLLAACTPTPENVQKSDLLPPLYPDYCDVTIPVNIAPLNFLLRADCEAVEVKAGDITVNYKGNEVVFDCVSISFHSSQSKTTSFPL